MFIPRLFAFVVLVAVVSAFAPSRFATKVIALYILCFLLLIEFL